MPNVNADAFNFGFGGNPPQGGAPGGFNF